MMSEETQTFTVRVVETRGNQTQAVANALVIVRQGQTTIIQTTTNTSGEVQLTLPHGSYSLEVRATHFQTASMDITVPVSNNLVTVTLQRLTQTITFVVLNSANNVPAPNVRVIVYKANHALVTQGYTDQEGRFTATLEHGYTYFTNLVFDSVVQSGINFSIPSSSTLLTHRLSSSFRFRIVNERNEGVRGVNVTIENLSRGTRIDRTAYYDWLWESIYNPGQYRVTFSKEGWKRVVRTYEYGSTQIGDITDTIVLSPTRLNVIVLDPQGNPARGALVRVIRNNSVIREGTTS